MNFIIITVGNELLSGDIVNSNAAYMAKKLTMMGHRVFRIVTVPDDVEEISKEIEDAVRRADFVIVSGGLGATHDDVTTEAVAKALNRRIVICEEVYNHLRKFIKNEEAVRKMSSVPEGAEVIWNDVGAAPAYIIDKIAVLPGVPAEMENTFEKILKKFEKLEFCEEVVKLLAFESQILDKLNRVVKDFPDVQIGSYPKPDHLMIKFSGSNSERVREAKRRFLELLNDQGKNILQG